MLAGSKILTLLGFAARIVKFQRVNFKFGRVWALFGMKRGAKFTLKFYRARLPYEISSR